MRMALGSDKQLVVSGARVWAVPPAGARLQPRRQTRHVTAQAVPFGGWRPARACVTWIAAAGHCRSRS